MSDDAPTRIFDSGVGGLTAARAILDRLPGEALPSARVRGSASEVLDRVVGAGAKLPVTACDTASAARPADARERCAVAVVEVVPQAGPAVPRPTDRGRRVRPLGAVAVALEGRP